MIGKMSLGLLKYKKNEIKKEFSNTYVIRQIGKMVFKYFIYNLIHKINLTASLSFFEKYWQMDP